MLEQKCKNCINFRKVVIIGCGFVGSASAFSLMQSELVTDIVLIDENKERAEGEALDISHGIAFSKPTKIYAGDYSEVKDASIVIVTAGANQLKGETRLDLVKKNIDIYKTIIPKIKENGFYGLLLIVSNPVDILTAVAAKLSGLPENMVIGSGTVLDTARLKYEIGEYLNVDARGVHSFIIGEHGDSEIAVFSSANISGVKYDDFCKILGLKDYKEKAKKIAEKVKNSAYEIIAKKKATYFGIAASVRKICEAIIRNEKSILPVSSVLHGEYGISGIALSIPTIVGKEGIIHHVPINLDKEENEKLLDSAKILKDVLQENGF